MTCYYLCEWEINGYDDSDFMAIIYDDFSNTCFEKMIGTTRFAFPPSIQNSEAEPPTIKVIEQARKLLKVVITNNIVAENRRAIWEPNEISNGERVVLTYPHKNVMFNTEPCIKCNGSGYWINPKNALDKRECFTCHGKGFSKKDKVKENGKIKYTNIKLGTKGTVIETRLFGTFYDKGYKKPDRSNKQIVVRTDDGQVINVPLSKLALDKELINVDAAKLIGIKNSYNYDFGRYFGHRFTWYHRNYALEIAEGTKNVSSKVS